MKEPTRHPWKSFPKPCCSKNVLLMTMNSVTRFTSSTGHYTQVVWANTYKVGCGFTAYEGSDGWYNKYYVCNYGPGGNIIGGSMYEEGDPCTKCPGENSQCNNGLCVWGSREKFNKIQLCLLLHTTFSYNSLLVLALLFCKLLNCECSRGTYICHLVQ